MWRGPLGAFESKPLVSETVETVHALADSNTKTMLGKGDGAIVPEKVGAAKEMDRVWSADERC
jgi:3-phosphoglycerate kinase